MCTAHSVWGKALLAGGLALATFVPLDSAQARKTFKVLHEFAGGPSDGASPAASLIFDDEGNLYGTTAGGVLSATAQSSNSHQTKLRLFFTHLEGEVMAIALGPV